MTDEDPLEQLYVDAEEFNRERLANDLKGKIGIDQETGDPYYLGGFGKLNNKQKVVAYLLYRKAAVALNKLVEEEEGVESKTISEETGVNYKTVRSWLSQMDYVEKDKDRGGYYVPVYAMEKAGEVLSNE